MDRQNQQRPNLSALWPVFQIDQPESGTPEAEEFEEAEIWDCPHCGESSFLPWKK